MKKILWICIVVILVLVICACARNEFLIPDEVVDIELQVPVSSTQSIETPLPEITPLPSPMGSMLQTLYAGDENESVKKLQQRLIELKYLHTAVTGYYGEKTEAAVSRFQEVMEIEATGKADVHTQELLYSDDAKECSLPLTGYLIGIDPGHQGKANFNKEPVSPGSNVMKKKVSSGTQGRFTNVPEYQVTLDVGLLLRDLLEEHGATVIMTRETHDVDISNAERAQLFNDAKTDYALRLHCNGSENPDKYGAFMLVPTENPYKQECDVAAQLLIDSFCEVTGAKNLGLTFRSDQTGFNWCERMIINIEMGHMTNEEEDHLLTSKEYQKKMAEGLLKGILSYFETKDFTE